MKGSGKGRKGTGESLDFYKEKIYNKIIKSNGVKDMTNSESREMYLETILRLQMKKGNVHAIDIAEELGYSKPSVSRAVGVLKKNEYIVVAPDGAITLTGTGKEKASRIFNRHKALTAAFEKMGVGAKSAEENACRIEHVISEDAFEAVKKHFGV